MTLSDKRAKAVRDFLVAQGVGTDAVTTKGFGESNPVASNATPAGRQQNRRVELVVSGNAIGSSTGAQGSAIGTAPGSSGSSGGVSGATQSSPSSTAAIYGCSGQHLKSGRDVGDSNHSSERIITTAGIQPAAG